MLNIYADEKWKDLEIENLCDTELIQISNFGRLRSFKVSKEKPKIIYGSWIGGYNAIVLKMKVGKSKTFYVHRLVAMHFIHSALPHAQIVIHLDFDKRNNHYSNLTWVTKKEAHLHHLKDVDYDKKKVRNAKLTETQVIAIKKMLNRGTIKPFRIAQQFGISQTQLLRIKSGKNWAHIIVE
jgi:hypothetical protein